jgi:hypothetical protein
VDRESICPSPLAFDKAGGKTGGMKARPVAVEISLEPGSDMTPSSTILPIGDSPSCPIRGDPSRIFTPFTAINLALIARIAVERV